MRLGLEDVLRNVDEHGTGPSGRRDVERLMHHLRQFRDGLHQEIVLGAGARDAERVGFLKRVAADQLGGNLAGDGDHRNGVHHRIHQAGNQIGGAGAGRGATNAHASRGARVAFGRERRVLLVPHQDVADGMVVESIVQRQRHAARIAENAVYVLTNQALQQNLGARHQLRFRHAARSMRRGGRHLSSIIALPVPMGGPP